MIQRELGLEIFQAAKEYGDCHCLLSCESKCYTDSADKAFLDYLINDMHNDMGIVDDLSSITAVSYTHLDVYKRQGLSYEDWKPPGKAKKPKPRQKSPEEQFQEAKNRCFRILADYLHPVSYTHLDVYKRQE